MRRCLIPLVLVLSSCGGSTVGQGSDILEPLAQGDDPSPGAAGERCNLAANDASQSGLRLVAVEDAAIARVGGAPVRLRFGGGDLHRGGTFEGGGLAVQIGGISGASQSSPRVSVAVVVAVRRGDEVENFEGMWTCSAEGSQG